MRSPSRAAAMAVALAAGFCGGALAAETLFNADFEDGDLSAWQTGGAGDARVTVYAGNHSLRLLNAAQATATVNTDGYGALTIKVSFAAYRLSPHDLCVAEYSIDDGKHWKAVTTVRPGQDDGLTLRAGLANVAASHAPRVLVRLRAQLSDPNGACWGDNVSVAAERG